MGVPACSLRQMGKAANCMRSSRNTLWIFVQATRHSCQSLGGPSNWAGKKSVLPPIVEVGRMRDAVYVLIVLLFFLASWGFVVLLDRLRGR